MNKYVCKILKDNEIKKENVYKNTIEEIYEKYDAEGITIISVEESYFYKVEKIFSKKVSDVEIYILINRLNILMRAGILISKSLEMVESQSENKKVKEKVRVIRDSIERGESISSSFKKGGAEEIVYTFLEVGERTGDIESSLKAIEGFYLDKIEIESKLKTAMIYPLVVSILMIVSIIVSLNYVIPNYEIMFESSGEELPVITKALINISKWVGVNGKNVIMIGLLISVGYLVGVRDEEGRIIRDKMKFKIPFYRRYYIKNINYKFSISMWIMISSSLNIVENLKLASEVMDNAYVKRNMGLIIDRIREGESLSNLLKEYEEYDDVLIHLCEVGEEIGTLDEMFLKGSEIYKEDLNKFFSKFQKNLEMGITLVLGIVLGFVMLGIMLPMFYLVNTI